MKKTLDILKRNKKTLVGFEFLYKFITVLIFGPFFLTCFHFITKIQGYQYLTFENFFSFLMHPFTLLFLLVLILFITFYTILDISTIILILDASYQKQKITIREAFLMAVQKSLRVFQTKNIFLPFLVLFLIPFLNIGLSTGYISTISIPEFIIDYIVKNQVLSILYFLLVIFLIILLFRWLYVLHYFVLEDCNFKEARKKSSNLSHQNKGKDFIKILLSQLGISVLYILFLLGSILLILLLYKIFGKNNLLGNLSITIIWLLIAFSIIIVTLLGTPISYAIISILFYQHKEQREEKIVVLKRNPKKEKKLSKNFKIFQYVCCVLLLFSASIFTYLVMNGYYDLNIEYVRTMEVTAHRGASAKYPENTMEAFVGAKELGADWIELDVQQTKDRKLIVLHDTNLKRTTGVNKNTWDVTYDEVKDLDAGSFFDKKFKDTRIPLLEEVIQFAKENHIKLNIELKPTGKEENFEEDVVDLIRKYDFEKDCVITSQVYEVLEKTKKYSSEVSTVYVMSLAYGDITELRAADNFSIEASSINKTMVQKIHAAGKELYAWTVNTPESIQKMITLHVDNIITDDIPLAKDTIYSSKTSNLIQEYVKFVENLF